MIKTIKLVVPAGQKFIHIDGIQTTPDANGLIDVPINLVSGLIKAGFTYPPATSTTALRPTSNLTPGQMHYDTTLGKPIWRNAANSGWTLADGSAA